MSGMSSSDEIEEGGIGMRGASSSLTIIGHSASLGRAISTEVSLLSIIQRGIAT